MWGPDAAGCFILFSGSIVTAAMCMKAGFRANIPRGTRPSHVHPHRSCLRAARASLLLHPVFGVTTLFRIETASVKLTSHRFFRSQAPYKGCSADGAEAVRTSGRNIDGIMFYKEQFSRGRHCFHPSWEVMCHPRDGISRFLSSATAMRALACYFSELLFAPESAPPDNAPPRCGSFRGRSGRKHLPEDRSPRSRRLENKGGGS